MRLSTTARRSALGIHPDEVHDTYERRGFADLADAELFDRAASVVSVPKQTAANSFVLHAPLELMARRLLLPHVAPRFRRAVRERMLWVAASYEDAGEPKEPPAPAAFDSDDDARRSLLHAITGGDVDRADAAAMWVLEHARPDDVMALAEPTLDMLAAAGHAPIGFFLASRLATTSRSSLMLLRPTLLELARSPELRLQWVRDASRPDGGEEQFIAALARTPQLGLPGTDFVYPIVHRVDASGVARDIVESNIPATVASAAAVILRVAARSMLQDDPAYVPYGWTHCLTLPHAILEILPWLSDRNRAAAIAATYVVAFRAAQGRHALATDWVPAPATTNAVDALDGGPDVAAAAWYGASDAARADALPELVGRAACHPDAHVAKYTLACVAAAHTDRSHRALYLAAAASLLAWWTLQPGTSFRDDL